MCALAPLCSAAARGWKHPQSEQIEDSDPGVSLLLMGDWKTEDELP